MHLYTALGFGSIAAVVVGLSVLMLRRSAAKDMGSVSVKWISEHREQH